MKSSEQKSLSILSREYLYQVWQMSKVDIHVMSEDDQLLSFIMNEHEEFLDYWENFEKWRDHEFDPEQEVNPYLHVSLHHMVETQIRNEAPPEVEKVFQALKNNGLDRQTAIHRIGDVFLKYLMRSLQEQKDFDMRAYLGELILLPQKI